MHHYKIIEEHGLKKNSTHKEPLSLTSSDIPVILNTSSEVALFTAVAILVKNAIFEKITRMSD